MSLGSVMLDLEGVSLRPEEREILQHPAVGGVILFARNYASPAQLEALTAEIHRIRQPSLLVAVDQEGGRVQRFRAGFTELPPASWFGELHRTNAARSRHAAEKLGWLMAAELRSAGVDFSFSPVLDLGRGVSEVIGDRSFADRPLVVAELARAWMKGMHAAGMASVGKHFPGHGSVAADSHHELPQDERRLEDILMDDLVPFQRMVDYGIEAIMPAHVIFTRIDSKLAGFSSFWLKDVLRRRLGFQGAIFSDDLSMAAAGSIGSPGERAWSALRAGCDMVLVCNDRPAALTMLDELEQHQDPAAHMRILRMHGRKHPTRGELHQDPAWQEANQLAGSFAASADLKLDL